MAAFSKDSVFWGGVALVGAIVAGVLFLFPASQERPVEQQAKTAVPPVYKKDIPRTAEPMAELTRFFEHHIFGAKEENGGGHDLHFYLYQPEKPYPPEVKFPLVLVLHGGPGNGYAAQALVERAVMRLNYPAFIVVPVLPLHKTWAFPEAFPEDVPLKEYFIGKEQDLPDAVDIIRELSKKYPVDTDRIYAIGCSEGGVGVYGALRNHADVFAAGVAISGLWTATDAAHLTKRPLVIMHGGLETDTPVELARAVAQQIKKHGGSVQYVEMAGMNHACPSPVFYGETTWKWLFAQRKPPAVMPR